MLTEFINELSTKRAQNLEALLKPYVNTPFDVAVHELNPKLRQEGDRYFLDIVFEWKLVKAGTLPEPRSQGVWTVYKTSKCVTDY
jgi:hypothetical protein